MQWISIRGNQLRYPVDRFLSGWIPLSNVWTTGARRVTNENGFNPKRKSTARYMYRWILFLSIPCTQRLVLLTCTLVLLTSFLLNIANAFQIWSMLAGYEELAKTFEPIRDGENYEKKKIIAGERGPAPDVFLVKWSAALPKCIHHVADTSL